MSGLTAALLGIEHPHSLAHLRTLQALPEVERILLWDENAAALESARAAQGEKVTAIFTNLDALLAEPGIGFVLTALRNDLGPAILLRVIAAGAPILTEKPIGRTARDAERVVSAAEAASVPLSVLYQNRYHPASQEARRVVQSGALGPLVSMEARMITTGVRFRDPQHWFLDRAQAGGGILSWLGCHYLDLLRYVAADEVASVTGQVATLSGEAIDVEDVATATLRFRSGALATFHAGYMLALSGSGFHNSGYDAFLGFRGPQGRVFWDPAARPPRVYAESATPAWASAPKREFGYELGSSPGYGGMIGETFVRDFIRSLRGEGPPPTTGRDAVAVARIVDAVYESSRSGRRIDL